MREAGPSTGWPARGQTAPRASLGWEPEDVRARGSGHKRMLMSAGVGRVSPSARELRLPGSAYRRGGWAEVPLTHGTAEWALCQG